MTTDAARGRLAEGLRQGLARAAAESAPLDYETLEAYVDGRLDAADREIVETRLADDPDLLAEVNELRALQGELGSAPLNETAVASTAEPPAAPRPASPVASIDARRARPTAPSTSPSRSLFAVSPTFAAAASVVLVLGAGVAWWIRAGNVAFDFDRASTGPASSGAGSAPVAAPKAPAGAALAVRDGEQVVTLAADRTVTGLDHLDPTLRAHVAEMLATGKLPAPAHVLTGARGQLLSGGREAAAGFAVRTPVGTAVREPLPAFQWTPAPDATGYRVRIVDESLEVVAESDTVLTTTWRPRAALPRGRTLQWQVEADVPSGHELAPTPPAPEARFRILTDAEDAELTRALGSTGESSLAALYLYSSAGLRSEARRVISALAGANPDSDVLQRLYADLRQR